MLKLSALEIIRCAINDDNEELFDGIVDEAIPSITEVMTYKDASNAIKIVNQWYISDQSLSDDKLKKYRTVIFGIISIMEKLDRNYTSRLFDKVDINIVPFYLFISHNMGDLIADRTKIKFFDHYFNTVKYGKEYNK